MYRDDISKLILALGAIKNDITKLLVSNADIKWNVLNNNFKSWGKIVDILNSDEGINQCTIDNKIEFANSFLALSRKTFTELYSSLTISDNMEEIWIKFCPVLQMVDECLKVSCPIEGQQISSIHKNEKWWQLRQAIYEIDFNYLHWQDNCFSRISKIIDSEN